MTSDLSFFLFFLLCAVFFIFLKVNNLLLSVQKSAAAREQELRVRATVLQTDFENYVHGSAETVQAAKKGKCSPTSRTFTMLLGLHITAPGVIFSRILSSARAGFENVYVG